MTLPATAIIPVVRSDASVGTWNLTQWMAATQGASWSAYCQRVELASCAPTDAYPVLPDSDMVSVPGDSGVSQYVAQSDANGAIGFTLHTWALETGLPVASVLERGRLLHTADRRERRGVPACRSGRRELR